MTLGEFCILYKVCKICKESKSIHAYSRKGGSQSSKNSQTCLSWKPTALAMGGKRRKMRSASENQRFLALQAFFYAILPVSWWNVCSFHGTLKTGQRLRKRVVGSGIRLKSKKTAFAV